MIQRLKLLQHRLDTPCDAGAVTGQADAIDTENHLPPPSICFNVITCHSGCLGLFQHGLEVEAKRLHFISDNG